MKKRILVLITVVSILFAYFSCVSVWAIGEENEKEISYYKVKIDPRSDYSLDIHFDIKYQVEETTSWIKLEIPNDSIDEMKAISDNIDEVIYYIEEDTDYIRINLKKEYQKDETLEIQFSIHQSELEVIHEDSVYYNYIVKTNQFKTDTVEVYWNKNSVLNCSSIKFNTDGYYVWKQSCESDENICIFVQYSANDEIMDNKEEENSIETEQDEDKIDDFFTIFIIVILVAMIVIGLAALLSLLFD